MHGKLCDYIQVLWMPLRWAGSKDSQPVVETSLGLMTHPLVERTLNKDRRGCHCLC